jgi:oxygen-independent coproporphyrinogen-3 oxidase
VGFGISAIGELGGVYAQNEKTLDDYYAAIDAGRFPIHCGVVLSEDDTIRRWLIRQIMCNFHLDLGELERRFGVDYDTYFAEEEKALGPLYKEGFLVREGNALHILPLGQVFVRNISMVFDAYLRRPEGHHQFSRTV